MTTTSHHNRKKIIAYFVSPHGFGHATRAVSVMAAIHELDPTVHFEIFTGVSSQLFEDSFPGSFSYHSLLTDIGLVQKDSLTEDLSGTLRRLDDFLPYDLEHIKTLARQLTELQCDLVVCDIAPLGIAVALVAGIPSILIENFTWDWIYEGYLDQEPRLRPHIGYLRNIFKSASYHIQAEPIAEQRPSDMVVSLPISRKFRTPIEQTRQKLAVPDQAKMVLITLGGVPGQYPFLDQLSSQQGLYFVIPGASTHQTQPNLLLLPPHSDFFHPDLINAADVVIGKAGYSTMAEIYYAGVPFGYVSRPKFPETESLVAYIDQHLNSLAISQRQFEDGSWLSCLPDLLAMPRLERSDPNGADLVAQFILDRL